MAIVEQKQSSFPCQIKDLRVVKYLDVYFLQKEMLEKVLSNNSQYLILCEHYPVLTLGRLTSLNSILASNSELAQKRIKTYNIDRGGDVTLHSPGQLVIYPIFNLGYYGKDLKQYLFKLEQVAIDLLGDFDILASRILGRTGVWVKDRKIASIGIGVKKWISYHGIAININTDLELFSTIKPCGLNVKMTSLSELLQQAISMNTVKQQVISHFCRIFNLKICN